MAGKIFVNYRRDDSAPYALTVAQYLERSFGHRNVFIDIDRMRAGQKFPEVLEQRLGQCDVMVTVIGPDWLDMPGDDGRRRLDDPEDWVRLEIERALARGVVVIPVTVGGARLPRRDELPEPLRPLVDHHAANITRDGFRAEMAALAQDIKASRKGGGAWRWAAVGVVALAIAAGGAAVAWQAGVWPAATGIEMVGNPSARSGKPVETVAVDSHGTVAMSKKAPVAIGDPPVSTAIIARDGNANSPRSDERSPDKVPGTMTGRLYEVHNPAASQGFNYSNLVIEGSDTTVVVRNKTQLCFEGLANPRAPAIDQRAKVHVLDGRHEGTSGTLSMQVVRPLGDMACEVSRERSSSEVAASENGVHATAPKKPKESGVQHAVFSGVEVVYFEKQADGGRVSKALDRWNIPHRTDSSTLSQTFETNALACAPDTPVNAIKYLAEKLIESGIELRAIIRFRNPARKPRTLEILAASDDPYGESPLRSPPLSLEEITKLTECPTDVLHRTFMGRDW